MPQGFVVALLSAHAEAIALVAAGKGHLFIELVYVGQELRGAMKARLMRLTEHFTTEGSPNLLELCRRYKDCYCVPLARPDLFPSPRRLEAPSATSRSASAARTTAIAGATGTSLTASTAGTMAGAGATGASATVRVGATTGAGAMVGAGVMAGAGASMHSAARGVLRRARSAPTAACFTLQSRILSFLPPRHEMVDVFEASMVLLLLLLGVVLLNDSPPCTPGGSRFFEETGRRAAQLPGCVARWVVSQGGPAIARRTLVRDKKPPWLRRALAASEMLLYNGAFVLLGGARVVPEVLLRGNVRAFGAMQCAEALLCGMAQHERVVAAWCRGCNCPARVRLCACLALVEARNGVLLRSPQLFSPVLALLRPNTKLVQVAENVPFAEGARFGTAAAPPPTYADIFSDAVALTGVAALLLGEGDGWQEQGSASRIAALMRFNAAVRTLFTESWKEAAAPSLGGAVGKRRRSATAAEVAASCVRPSAASVVATQPTAASEMLRHLVRRSSGGAAAAVAPRPSGEAQGRRARCLCWMASSLWRVCLARCARLAGRRTRARAPTQRQKPRRRGSRMWLAAPLLRPQADARRSKLRMPCTVAAAAAAPQHPRPALPALTLAAPRRPQPPRLRASPRAAAAAAAAAAVAAAAASAAVTAAAAAAAAAVTVVPKCANRGRWSTGAPTSVVQSIYIKDLPCLLRRLFVAKASTPCRTHAYQVIAATPIRVFSRRSRTAAW